MSKPAYFSLGFLILFITSVSTNTFISLNGSVKQIIHITKTKEINQNASAASASEDLVFEETENDGEDTVDPIYTYLPDFLNFDVFIQKVNTHVSEFIDLHKKLNSLFLSFRVIKI